MLTREELMELIPEAVGELQISIPVVISDEEPDIRIRQEDGTLAESSIMTDTVAAYQPEDRVIVLYINWLVRFMQYVEQKQGNGKTIKRRGAKEFLKFFLIHENRHAEQHYFLIGFFQYNEELALHAFLQLYSGAYVTNPLELDAVEAQKGNVRDIASVMIQIMQEKGIIVAA